LAAVVGAEGASGGDRDVDPVGIAGVENDGVQAHAPGSGLPVGSSAVAAQAGQLLPVLPAVGGAKQRGILDSGVNRVGIGERRFEMPDALELPGMLVAVVKLVSCQRLSAFRRGVVHELVAFAFGRAAGAGGFTWGRSGLMPGLAAVVGPLNHLAEPAAGLGGVDAIRVGWRTF